MLFDYSDFITIDNVRIAYYEKNPQRKQTIFFVHGNSGSGQSWREQFNSSILADFRLLAIDLPGHGASDAALVPEVDYTLTASGNTLAKIADLLLPDDSNVIFVGLSYGANVLAEMLQYRKKIAGIALISPTILGNAAPIEKIFKPDDSFIFFQCAPEEDKAKKAIAALLFDPNEKNIALLMDIFYQVKQPFRSTIAKVAAQGLFNDEIKILRQLNTPILISFGTNDTMVYTNYLDTTGIRRWNNTTHLINEAGHFVQLEQPEELNRLLQSYARDCFK